MAKIAVAGTGYVGLVSGACLADFGNYVICVDSDKKKIEALKKGVIPIFEPGLDRVVERNVSAGRLRFTDDMTAAVRDSDVVFIAVGTPPLEDGSADLQYVEAVAREIARAMNSYKVIVDKSTVPVGTARNVTAWINDELKKQNRTCGFDVVSNPEFLREGNAIQDFTHPDRVVIGAESEKAASMMKEVYRALYLNETPYIETNLETAEMIKYASNAFLAVKITFINEIANLCEKAGADVKDVARAMGRDKRIGDKFLHPGPGYGGSCFPKDTRAIVNIAKRYGSTLSVIEAAISANENQKIKMADKIRQAVGGNLSGKTIAILGLAFKPNTDDTRESPVLTIIPRLIKEGAVIRACDPAAIPEAKMRFEKEKQAITYFEDEYEAVKGADCLVIMTEWNSYRNLDLEKIKLELNAPVLCDLRNVYKRKTVEGKGFTYIGVGT